MLWVREVLPDSKRRKLYNRALWITLLGNSFLTVIKGSAAYLNGSTAIFSDAANSISDVMYSILLFIGLWIAQRPPDLSHPQGHSRFEPLVALVITISMSLAGFGALYSSLIRFMAGGAAIELSLATMVLSASAVIKVGMFYLVGCIARDLKSPGLKAASSDNLSDVLTSMAALLGVIGSNFINPLFDPAAGIFITAWIFRAAFLIAKENVGYLTGAGASKELRERILQTAHSVSGVSNVHHVVSDYVGSKLVVDIHINLDGKISLNKAHAICDKVAEKVEDIPDVDRAYVHAEPLDHL